MLEVIKTLPESICNIVLYSNCSSIEYIAQRMIMQKFGVSANYTYSISSQKLFKETISTVNTLPLQGERWLLVVDVDKLGVSESLKDMNIILSTAIVIYLTHNYKTYKSLINSSHYKQQGSTNFATQLYFGKLTDASINLLYDYYTKDVSNGYDIPKKLMTYLRKNYKYNPDLVCELFSKIKDGAKLQQEKEVIELVGVGGNTPQALTISLLTTTTNTKEGKKRFLKKNLMLFNDLSIKYSYDTTYSYMISTLKGIIDMKQLQISGKYFEFYKNIPESFADIRLKRMNRLHRFEYVILNKISLRRALVLLQCMQSKDFNKQQVILQGIYDYTNRLGSGDDG